ncbi:hypothetical protein K440DRAFT_410397 [Wilcoxina mikolae CBS 423.85]|nr:hypothetical protein K440DRAFT_410397 [Wilcoxina mikolae CBS 423.85]
MFRLLVTCQIAFSRSNHETRRSGGKWVVGCGGGDGWWRELGIGLPAGQVIIGLTCWIRPQPLAALESEESGCRLPLTPPTLEESERYEIPQTGGTALQQGSYTISLAPPPFPSHSFLLVDWIDYDFQSRINFPPFPLHPIRTVRDNHGRYISIPTQSAPYTKDGYISPACRAPFSGRAPSRTTPPSPPSSSHQAKRTSIRYFSVHSRDFPPRPKHPQPRFTLRIATGVVFLTARTHTTLYNSLRLLPS